MAVARGIHMADEPLVLLVVSGKLVIQSQMALARLYSFMSQGQTDQTYAFVGTSYCRGPGGDNDKLPSEELTGVSSIVCRDTCTFNALCIAYHWQHSERCQIYSGSTPATNVKSTQISGECYRKVSGIRK